jgi:hypothetical protein
MVYNIFKIQSGIFGNDRIAADALQTVDTCFSRKIVNLRQYLRNNSASVHANTLCRDAILFNFRSSIFWYYRETNFVTIYSSLKGQLKNMRFLMVFFKSSRHCSKVESG